MGLVLVVDSAAKTCAGCCSVLSAAGYGVTVATDTTTARLRAAQADPDLLLINAHLDADANADLALALALARSFKSDAATAHIPIVFCAHAVCGEVHSDTVVAAFEAGAVDCVRADISGPELTARLATHVRAARHARQARNALDAYGHATLAVHVFDSDQAAGQLAIPTHKPAIKPTRRPLLVWQTPLARAWLPTYFDSPPDVLPEALLQWLHLSITGQEKRPLTVMLSLPHEQRQLVCTLQSRTGDGDWLIVLRQVSDAATVEATMRAFRLTPRESEVLYWVVKGKTNRDVSDILGSSPATVKKHLERVYEKLGVETRTAAAAMAMQRVRALNPA
jgi:DNA-binding NarL/FixJ family response regulator